MMYTLRDPAENENTKNCGKVKRGLHGMHKQDCVMCVFFRASDDLKNNMVAVETMEQFQKELDQGKVSNTIHTQSKTFHCLPLAWVND